MTGGGHFSTQKFDPTYTIEYSTEKSDSLFRKIYDLGVIRIHGLGVIFSV
jgi:hypothetical protein